MIRIKSLGRRVFNTRVLFIVTADKIVIMYFVKKNVLLL